MNQAGSSVPVRLEVPVLRWYAKVWLRMEMERQSGTINGEAV